MVSTQASVILCEAKHGKNVCPPNLFGLKHINMHEAIFCGRPMVNILNDNSEIGAHVWNDLRYLIW